MTRKKRKVASIPRKLPTSRKIPGKWESFVAPWLGGLAFLAAYFAVLGGISDRTLDWRQIFDHDTLRPWFAYQDAFLSDVYSLDGWSFSSAAPFWFPEFAFQWPLLALGADIRTILYIAPLVQVGAAAWGWALVCNAIFGKSPVRCCFVWLSHALAFLVLAWRGGDLLAVHFVTAFHYGAWLSVPWLLWLSLRILNPEIPPRQNIPALAGLIALLAVSTWSDLVILNWFTFPAALAAILTTRMSSPQSRRALLACVAALLVGTALPQILALSGPSVRLSPSWELTARTIGRLSDIMARIAGRNLPESLVWLLFVGIAAWRTLCVLPRLEIFGDGNSRKLKPGRGAFHSLVGVPSGRTHRFVAVFVSASAAAAIGSVLLSGNLDIYPWVLPEVDRLTRHYLPFVYFPLFVGWVLLPWNFGKSPLQMRPPILAAGLCACVVGISGVKAAAIDLEKMDPFGTPFQKCFAESARRLGWRRGIGLQYQSFILAGNPDDEIGRMPMIQRNYRLGNPPPITGLQSFSNRNWWRDAEGKSEFQFAVVNLFQGRVFGRPPRGAEDAGCPPTIPEMLECFSSPEFILDEATARRTFGEPAEVIDCGGAGLFHYDPPLRFSPPDNLEEIRTWRVAPEK